MTKKLATTALLAACSFTGGATSVDATEVIDTPIAPMDAPDGDAPDAPDTPCVNFTALPPQTSTYYFGPTMVSWLEAEADCEDLGSHLAILDSADEAIALAAIVGGDPWVGFTDFETPDTWRDVAGRIPAYLPWKAGEPSTGGSDTAAIMKRGGADLGLLDAVNHTGAKFYVCECDGLAVDPTSYMEEETK